MSEKRKSSFSAPARKKLKTEAGSVNVQQAEEGSEEVFHGHVDIKPNPHEELIRRRKLDAEIQATNFYRIMLAQHEANEDREEDVVPSALELITGTNTDISAALTGSENTARTVNIVKGLRFRFADRDEYNVMNAKYGGAPNHQRRTDDDNPNGMRTKSARLVLKYTCHFCVSSWSKTGMDQHVKQQHLLKMTWFTCTATLCKAKNTDLSALRAHIRAVHKQDFHDARGREIPAKMPIPAPVEQDMLNPEHHNMFKVSEDGESSSKDGDCDSGSASE